MREENKEFYTACEDLLVRLELPVVRMEDSRTVTKLYEGSPYLSLHKGQPKSRRGIGKKTVF